LVSIKSNVMTITTKWWWKPPRPQYAHEDHSQDQGNKLIIQIITMWCFVTNQINVTMITTRIMIKLILWATWPWSPLACSHLMMNIFEGNNQCWVDIQNIQILDLDITHDIHWTSSWMIFGLIFSLSDIMYVMSCSLISEVYVRYKDLDI
jgi:hypothetical protein